MLRSFFHWLSDAIQLDKDYFISYHVYARDGNNATLVSYGCLSIVKPNIPAEDIGELQNMIAKKENVNFNEIHIISVNKL